MSFITKRERVFNEYDLYDLPARNEGKLKAYSSCTDARAWSHFCYDKTEHLVEIIKRNNETCRPKYIPTNVIVDTLMVTKNAEIARLRRKIEEFEQMLAVYDQLELSCDQKCEIANAHAAIKVANKELDDLCLDLDLSGFTEGIDSEAFETGKSRGDETSKYRIDETVSSRGTEEWFDEREQNIKKMETKSNQMGMSSPRDACTSARDQRIEEMQDSIIAKDAKLNAMQNTMAVMENDICEPYCIYAHIYTALEKIFGILCQNDKYKQYLDLLTAGRDTLCIDIKGKILFKLKVLEKFSLALIAPCSQEFTSPDCACYHAEIVARVETTFALTSAETKMPSLDSKRAQLVADIMENNEMKEILNKKTGANPDELPVYDEFCTDNYTLDGENLKRLKNLQINYDDLITCYEDLKHEKNCLQIRCHKYEGLENELENLRCQLREYNSLWNEKEYHRKRSIDLDNLKEQYLVLSDEASNLETQLKAESEINNLKSKAINELRNDNILLEKKLNDTMISFEKEKNSLECKLKEMECTVMCQEQQIKSLTIQIDRILEEEHDKVSLFHPDSKDIGLIDQNDALKEQIKNLKDALSCNEEEKQNLQEEFQDKLKIINDLRMEIEDWKSTYENVLQRNNYLENYTDTFKDEAQRLIEENRTLAQDIKEKNTAIVNLRNIIKSKSEEISNLSQELEHKDSKNNTFVKQLQDLQVKSKSSIEVMVKEKNETLTSLQLARQESQELLKKVKDYDDIIHKNDDMSKALEAQIKEYNELKNLLLTTIEENKSLQMNLTSRENNITILSEEIQTLRELNEYSKKRINILKDERDQYQVSYNLTKKESEDLAKKNENIQHLKNELECLKNEHRKLRVEKQVLQSELEDKNCQLNTAIHSIEVTKKESGKLMQKIDETEKLKENLLKVNRDYDNLYLKTQLLEKNLTEKNIEIEMCQQDLKHLKQENENLLKISENEIELRKQLIELKKSYDDILMEKRLLQNDFENNTKELNNLYNALESKIEENRVLDDKIKALELQQLATKNNIKILQSEKLSAQSSLEAIKKESRELIDKLHQCEILKKEFKLLEENHEALKDYKEHLERELINNANNVNKLTKENNELQSQSQTLLKHSENLEKALISARTQDVIKPECIHKDYTAILAEIDDMKKEKSRSSNRIRELLDKLDESENIIANLSEDMLARDDRIAILENHINGLEEEVRKLHDCLAKVVHTGEQINRHSYEEIDQTLKRMEAHHSKATHNMKMELAKLQNKNMKLEEQLSLTKLKTEESLLGQNKYISQLINLQNEREIIVDDIRNLELNSVGDSTLLPNNSNLKDILTSLNRICKYIEAKCSKSATLEQTLLKVQTSSQLLLTKADEAKRIVEIEKQKIINEKEEAIKDRVNIENQLEFLKKTLEQKISQDQEVITDLEAEILNKDLIIEKINKTTQNYISKLETEIQSLQEMYKSSTVKINELQDKLVNISKDKKNDLEAFNKCKIALEKKTKDMADLENELQALNNKQITSTEVQTVFNQAQHNIASQTEAYSPYTEYERSGINEKAMSDDEKSSHSVSLLETTMLPKKNPPVANEVQVLTANIEPTFDYVKSSYLSYKLKRLTPGRLEQHSISSLEVKSEEYTSTTNLSTQILSPSIDKIFNNFTSNYGSPTDHNNLIDIYNKPSLQTNSSKLINNDTYVDASHSIVRPSGGFELEVNRYSGEAIIIKTDKRHVTNSEMFAESTSKKSPDKDLFVIYRDSESSNLPGLSFRRGSTQNKYSSDLLIEEFTVNSTEEETIYKSQSKNYVKIDPSNYKDKENKDDSMKYKLNIKLPRVQNDSPSLITSSEGDKKSLNSYQLGIYPSPRIISSSCTDIQNENDTILDTPSLPVIPYNESMALKYNDSQHRVFDKEILRNATRNQAKQFHSEGAKQPKNKNITNSNTRHLDFQKIKGQPHRQKREESVNKKEDESHHQLSRIGADVFLIKTNEDNNISDDTIYKTVKEPRRENFGLNYIFSSVQREINPINDMTVNDVDMAIRKIQSEEKCNKLESQRENTLFSSKLDDYNETRIETKADSNICVNRDKDISKTFKNQSVMVEMDTNEKYQNKIRYLTNALINAEKDFKKKVDAIKMQYDSNIKSIMNEHNEGVKSIQDLHEETLHDLLKIHENEVENLRSMSIEAMRKVEKIEKENHSLKTKIQDYSKRCLDEEPIKISIGEAKRRRKSRDVKVLSKTNVEAFNVKPRTKSHGPCTCSLDVNLTDTIRHIFEQVDVEQRKVAEHTYMKYIANKILNENVEALDAQELSFLHLKVCRIWKLKLTKEEVLQKRIDSLENELSSKRQAQQLSKLDREVAEERRRLQELRDAVCRNRVHRSRDGSPGPNQRSVSPAQPATATENDLVCNCQSDSHNCEVGERRSAGDLLPASQSIRLKRTKTESNRAVLAKLDIGEHREKKLYSDEPPTRLRKSHDRHVQRTQKKIIH